MESFTLIKKTYMISGSPKCPLTGLTGGELRLGINTLSFEKQSFSIAQ